MRLTITNLKMQCYHLCMIKHVSIFFSFHFSTFENLFCHSLFILSLLICPFALLSFLFVPCERPFIYLHKKCKDAAFQINHEVD